MRRIRNNYECTESLSRLSRWYYKRGLAGGLPKHLAISEASNRIHRQWPAISAKDVYRCLIHELRERAGGRWRYPQRVNPQPRFMTLRQIAKHKPAMRRLGVSKVARGPRGFLAAYKRAGSARKLSAYWVRRREGFIRRHLAQYKKNRERSGGRRWLALVAWAYRA